jgi:transposase
MALLPGEAKPGLQAVVQTIGSLTKAIRRYDKAIHIACKESFPQAQRLSQVAGVGDLIALAFVLTIEDPRRFGKSRSIGPYLGLVPKRDDSGDRSPQLRITKHGDKFLRRLMVIGAHYILGPHGPDTDLRRWGLKLCQRGGKNAKKRAVVAVARKLAVLLIAMLKNGQDYRPLRDSS